VKKVHRLKKNLLLSLPLAALLAVSLPVFAADPPPPGWHGSFSAGLSMNSGNSDARSFNLGVDLKYDPKTKNVLKLGALYLRSDANDTTTSDKLSAFARDEYSITDRFFAYGEVSFLRDKVALLDSLFAPAAGVGYKLIKTDTTTLDVSAGFGGAFEKYEGRESTSSAAILAGESVAWKISPTVALTQKATALWKTKDTGDAYYHFEAGLTTSLSKLLELKVAYLLDHKTRPAIPTLDKTDTALIVAVVAKF
jgi:putative salt-induced outer membrane protein YdiY